MPQSLMSANYLLTTSIFLWFFCPLAQASALAGTNVHICDAAAEIASAEVGVPLQFLQAIARTESGISKNGQFSPWPWTVNVAGKGAYYQTKRAAKNQILNSIKRGIRNIDVGCFQLNHKWHGAHFTSVEQMLDPGQNARYAAVFLKQLYAEFGDWETAAGAYHSRSVEFSQKYLTRLIPILHSLNLNAGQFHTIGGLVQRFDGNKKPSSATGYRTPGSLFPSASARRDRLIHQKENRG